MAVKMPFGKFKNTYLHEIDDAYLFWVLALPDLHGWLKLAIEHELEDRGAASRSQGQGRRQQALPVQGADPKVAAQISVKG